MLLWPLRQKWKIENYRFVLPILYCQLFFLRLSCERDICFVEEAIFVRTRARSNGTTQAQIVENHRRGTKVVQKLVRSVGHAASQQELDQFVAIAEVSIVELKNPRLELFCLKFLHLCADKSEVRTCLIARIWG